MKVPLHLVEERRRQLAAHLRQHAYAPLSEVCARFGISAATARRDLAALAGRKQIVRTRGGALTGHGRLLPAVRSHAAQHAAAEARIAAAARTLILPGTTCFLDAGTTVYALAEELRRQPVTGLHVVTTNLPVADLLTTVPGTRVSLLAGELLPGHLVLVGLPARKALRFYKIGLAFLGGESADATGVWNAPIELVALQRAVLACVPRCALCLDASRIGRPAAAFLAPWKDFDVIITDAAASIIQALTPGEIMLV